MGGSPAERPSTGDPAGRSGFAASLAGTDDVSFAPGDLLASLLVAAGLTLLLVFPALLVEQTLSENYDDIRRWLVPSQRVRSRLDRLREHPHPTAFLLFAAAAALTYGFLDPGFGLNESSLATFGGLLIGIVAVVGVLEAATLVHVRRVTGTRGHLRGAPGALVLALVMVVVSRRLDLEPGYVYGVVAGAAFSATLDPRTEGRSATYAATWTAAAAATAWLLHQPVSDAAADGGSLPLFLLDAALATVAVAGIEALAFGLLPLRFLMGEKVKRTSGLAWLALLVLGWLGVVHIILDPAKGVTEQGAVPPGRVMALFVAFGLFSAVFWGAFRLRAGILQRPRRASAGLDESERVAASAHRLPVQPHGDDLAGAADIRPAARAPAPRAPLQGGEQPRATRSP